jgi:hypothetical protein
MKYDYLTASTRKGGDRPVKRPKPRVYRGEQCTYAVLDEKLVRRIRSMYVEKQKGATYIQRELAKDGIHIKRPTICNVLYGISWTHVR